MFTFQAADHLQSDRAAQIVRHQCCRRPSRCSYCWCTNRPTNGCTGLCGVGRAEPGVHRIVPGAEITFYYFKHHVSTLSSCSFLLQLSFIAELPPLSLAVYHVTKATAGSTPRVQYTVYRHGHQLAVHAEPFQVSGLQGSEADVPLSLSNKHIRIWSSPTTGLLQVRFAMKINENV